jgi:hypothetical protein
MWFCRLTASISSFQRWVWGRPRTNCHNLHADTPNPLFQWMGYFLLYESMLDTVLLARDKYLVSRTSPSPHRRHSSLIATLAHRNPTVCYSRTRRPSTSPPSRTRTTRTKRSTVRVVALFSPYAAKLV